MGVDPNSIPDSVADAAQVAFHEFALGSDVPLSERGKGISRQGWRVSVAAALDAMASLEYRGGKMSEKMVRVWWYSHDCEWITKCCDEAHVQSVVVPESLLNIWNVGEGK